jgi:hypothetical protein
LHWSFNFNCTDSPSDIVQYGGTALVGINRATHRVIDKGGDKSMLGQWSWTKYHGRQNQSLCILSAYRPNPPAGPCTVYAQQQQFYYQQSNSHCPRQAFVENLCSLRSLCYFNKVHILSSW